MAATNTYKSFLMKGNEKLVDIKEFPDMGGTPETIDVTTLSDNQHVFIKDIVNPGDAMEFKANYDKEDFAKLKALEGKQESYGLWFGGTVESGTGALTPTGTEGKWSFTGELSVRLDGAGVGDARGMTIAIVPSTEIKFA